MGRTPGFCFAGLDVRFGAVCQQCLGGGIDGGWRCILGAADCFRRSRDRPHTHSPTRTPVLGHCHRRHRHVPGKSRRFYRLEQANAVFAIFCADGEDFARSPLAIVVNRRIFERRSNCQFLRRAAVD